ncbi:hypothetical protein ACEOWJ_004588 [Bacillus cereus]|uniref:hypothetical protein n=1 Tax=Bacillus pseudomycoides TaxID=64104 RepID=UPI002FFE208A
MLKVLVPVILILVIVIQNKRAKEGKVNEWNKKTFIMMGVAGLFVLVGLGIIFYASTL